MERPLRIYADTSVIGGCLDDEFKEASAKLMAMFRDGVAVLLASELLARELSTAPVAVQGVLGTLEKKNIEDILISQEAITLRERYLTAGVVGPKSADDALHVALATVARADMIVSWNFKHIVHFDKMRGFNEINQHEGYAPLTILSPLEVI